MTRLRPLVAASLPLLVGCAVFLAATPAAEVPPSPTSSPAPPLRRTPFAPNAPTPSPAPPELPGGPPEAWPPPFTYGSAPTPPVEIPPPSPPFTFPEGTLNILLIGSDRRGGRSYRTDTLVVASIQPNDGLVVLVSVPRDLYLYLPGYGMSRINSAWVYGETLGYPGGGSQMLLDTVRYNLGLPIHRYAFVEMSGFKAIVDLLGGLDVRVSCRYTDWRLRRPDLPEGAVSSWELFTVPAGIVHMDGDYALWYARARLRSSDFDRSRRQHEVLRAAYRQALRPAVLTRLPELYNAARASVVTNVSLQDVLRLAPFAVGLEPAHVRSRFIGKGEVTSFRVPGSGAAVLLPDPAAVHALLEEAFSPAGEPAATDGVTVEIVPGSRADLAWLALERLTYAGIEARMGQSDPTLGAETRVYASAQTASDAVEAIRRALGLSSRRLASLSPDEVGVRVRVLIGDDYQPCFDPTEGEA